MRPDHRETAVLDIRKCLDLLFSVLRAGLGAAAKSDGLGTLRMIFRTTSNEFRRELLKIVFLLNCL